MKNARNLKKCVFWSVVATVILILTMVTVYSGDFKLKTEENIPGKEFKNFQQPIHDLKQPIDDLQQQKNVTQRTLGPAAPEGPKSHSGLAGADGSQGPARPQGLVLIVH